MSITVKIDTKKFERAMKLYPKAARSAIARELGQFGSDVQVHAIQNHRYKTRTGKLEASAIPTLDVSRLRIVIKLHDGIARYGKYIHRGFKGWQADPFLYRAFQLKLKGMQQKLERTLVKIGKGIFS